MLIFIISVLLVSFISLCFFKSKFWQNRYLVLLICAGVALVATLVTNYIVRGKLQTKTVVVREIPILSFNIPNTLLVDNIPLANSADWDLLMKRVIVY